MASIAIHVQPLTHIPLIFTKLISFKLQCLKTESSPYKSTSPHSVRQNQGTSDLHHSTKEKTSNTHTHMD